jgi:hypothetical protein
MKMKTKDIHQKQTHTYNQKHMFKGGKMTFLLGSPIAGTELAAPQNNKLLSKRRKKERKKPTPQQGSAHTP